MGEWDSFKLVGDSQWMPREVVPVGRIGGETDDRGECLLIPEGDSDVFACRIPGGQPK